MNEFVFAFIAGECFLLGFLLYFVPPKRNAGANSWLSFFVFILGTAFIVNYLEKTGLAPSSRHIIKLLTSLQFLLAPSLYLGILSLVNPSPRFKVRYWLHFLPFAVYATGENVVYRADTSIGSQTLFHCGAWEFWVRDLLPFLVSGYVVQAFLALRKHSANLKLIASATHRTDLRWLRRFLLFLILPLAFWLYDALSLFPAPLPRALSGYIYAGSIFFLAFNAMRQGVIFPYTDAAWAEISELLPPRAAQLAGAEHRPRLSAERMDVLARRLEELMEVEKIYLDNELSLPAVAAKLGVSIHDASYLINNIAGDNFYNFVNRYRVAEARRLLTSASAKKLNMLGLAFAAGFNSKTAFNTAFKKWVGVSPSAYVRDQENR